VNFRIYGSGERNLADKGGWAYIKGRGLTLEMSVMEYREWCGEIQITICNRLERKKEEAVGSVESDPALLMVAILMGLLRERI